MHVSNISPALEDPVKAFYKDMIIKNERSWKFYHLYHLGGGRTQWLCADFVSDCPDLNLQLQLYFFMILNMLFNISKSLLAHLQEGHKHSTGLTGYYKECMR